MFRAYNLSHYSTDFLIFMAFALVLLGVIIGYVTDAVMKDRGFGPIGNGILCSLGAFVGIYVRNAYFGRLQGDEVFITGLTAGASATIMLLVLGIAKRWVQD